MEAISQLLDTQLLFTRHFAFYGAILLPFLALIFSTRQNPRRIRTGISWLDAYFGDEENVEPECSAMSNSLNACPVLDEYTACAEQMREMLKTNYLPYKSLEHDPGIVMKCARHTKNFNGAIYTRFIVQYNLFAGSIISLGSIEQREILYETQAQGSLGCFAFTEIGAGVITGLKVETTATFDVQSATFIINSNGATGRKVWISQGLEAEYAVILASLVVAGDNKGPHLFFARIQSQAGARLVPVAGVQIAPMASIHYLRGLDYATLEFTDFSVDASALLGRYCSVNDAGGYCARLPKGSRRMVDLLLNRLVTGRVCLSEYSVAYAKNLLRTSWTYASSRQLHPMSRADAGGTMADLPLVVNAFLRYAQSLAVIAAYLADTRVRLTEALHTETLTDELLEAACIAKFVGTSVAVDSISMLRKVMGSFSLTEASHLGASSFICSGICFAEGDNTIMELKVVGDLVKSKVSFLPLGVLCRSLWSTQGRAVIGMYLKCVLQAFLLGKAALKNGQLLKDIAWARAHLLIGDYWLQSSRPRSCFETYHATVVKFPTPVQI